VIFLTVGTQLPFDRLVEAVDEWAATAGEDVFAQIGPTALRPRHIEYVQFVSAAECANRMQAASYIVAHAGMGTILMALQLGKPLLVMPRRADLGEHRNDHQRANARRDRTSRQARSPATDRLATEDRSACADGTDQWPPCLHRGRAAAQAAWRGSVRPGVIPGATPAGRARSAPGHDPVNASA
jgi:UDP-N-acetylglucosamine transferase subunit ALG13